MQDEGFWVYTGIVDGGDSSWLDDKDPGSYPRDAKFILSLSVCKEGRDVTKVNANSFSFSLLLDM